MIRDEHIETAIAQGILTADQAARLRDLARAAASAAPDELAADPDDERFRLIGGFNDVFVTIGVGLLVAALFGLASVVGFTSGFAVLALAAAWGLSEFFSRRMRLALPSIALAIMFAGAGGFVGSFIGAIPFAAPDGGGPAAPGLFLLFGGLGVAIAALIHERRFRVPIDTAIGVAGGIFAAYGALQSVAPDWTLANTSLLTALFGIGVFAAAVRIDASDPERKTRRSDIAFWLHLLAAPMIVHAMIPLITGTGGEMTTGQAIGILAVFVLLGIVALVIDRRALLVSGLTYAGIAIAYLLSQSVVEGLGISLTLLGLAAIVLGLSAGWRSLRRAILPLLPLGSLRQSIPPAA